MAHRLISLAVVGLLAACSNGTSTDDASAGATDEAGVVDGENGGDSDGDNGGDADQIVIDDVDDIPAGCREIMVEFLQDIEPAVERIDWDTATLADMEDVTPVVDQMTIKFETGMEAAGCDDFTFGADDRQQFEFAVEIARQEAPGSESWLRFSRAMSAGLDTAADGSLEPSSLPADCDEATTIVTDLIGDVDSLDEVPVADLVGITNGILGIDAVCTAEQAAAFLDDPRLQELFGG